MDEIYDSPSEWVASHTRTYVESGGIDGTRLFDNDILLITTRGRRTGKLRRTPLMYGRDGDEYVVVASYRGQPHHPCWYLNLEANPEVTLQVGAEIFLGKARVADPDRKPVLWRLMTGLFPGFAAYQQQTTRQFPVIVIERAG